MIARLAPVAVLGIGCAAQGLDPVARGDPATCEGCHPDQFEAWAGSMHAYAADDPVFLAMNRLGQRRTDGALGDFCVRCHAPFADGRELEDLPRAERGVTCVACHQVSEVIAVHNGELHWDRDGPMRGGLRDPDANNAHASAYSPLLDGAEVDSSATCGACHDVVTPTGVEVERTYLEWSESVFADPATGASCTSCHMPSTGARSHDHRLAAVDVALTPWPGIAAQRAAIDRDLAAAITTRLCARPGAGVWFDVTLDNTQVGHAFPSGVTHARRARVTLVAEEAGAVVYELDPEAWVLGSRFLGADGAEVTHVWDAVALDGELLAPTVTLDPSDPAYYHAVTRSFLVPGAPDRARILVELEPVGAHVLDPLIDAGELAPEVRDAMPVLELAGSAKEWRRDRDGWGCGR